MYISDKERAPRHDSEKNMNIRVIDEGRGGRGII